MLWEKAELILTDVPRRRHHPSDRDLREKVSKGQKAEKRDGGGNREPAGEAPGEKLLLRMKHRETQIEIMGS